jgi:predicted ATPase
MAQHPFLKSIKPVNLLSFGPNTEEIELRPLNILIGPNGSGKSNLIEIIGLLSKLPDRDPWSIVIQTGGAPEWIWKGKNPEGHFPSLAIKASGSLYPTKKSPAGKLYVKKGLEGLYGGLESDEWTEKSISYSVELRDRENTFEVATERFQELDRWEIDPIETPWFERDGWTGHIHDASFQQDSLERFPSLPTDRSVLSVPSSATSILPRVPKIRDLAQTLEKFAFYRDWVFGSGSKVRDIQPAGFDSYRLAGDSVNLAQVLKAWRDRGEQTIFDRLLELLQKFYEPVRDVDTELLGTHLRIMIKEDRLSSRTPAERLSDGTLRWLMLLIILLDPAPPPVICIDEPELGLHPDVIHVLADLLREASTRTQLVVTTHSTALIDAFSDDPEAVCVCEKVDGSTVIKRLDRQQLSSWLEDYSLGQLWAKGEIGGNRW